MFGWRVDCSLASEECLWWRSRKAKRQAGKDTEKWSSVERELRTDTVVPSCFLQSCLALAGAGCFPLVLETITLIVSKKNET